MPSLTMADFAIGAEFEFHTSATRETVARALSRAGLSVHARDDGDCSKWRVKSDGSVPNGWEVISPKMPQAETLEQVRLACSAIYTLPEVSVSERCGFHVHLSGFAGCEFHVVRNVVRRYVNFEDTLDLMMPRDRRANNNTYCHGALSRFRGNTLAEQSAAAWSACEDVGNLRQLARLFNPNGRYHKVNLQSLFLHGTIEFRQHNGTVDAEEACNWIRFLWFFTETAMHQQRLWKRPIGTPETVDDRVRKITRRMPADLVHYVYRRIRAHAV